MILIPLLSAAASAIGTAHAKWLFGRTHLDTRTYLPAAFIIAFSMGTLLSSRWGGLTGEAVRPVHLVFLAVLIALMLIGNLFWVRGFRRETLHEYGTLNLLIPVLTIVFAAAIFADERDPIILSLTGFAIGTFFLTHLHHLHLSLKQADRSLLVAVVSFAASSLVSKPLLAIITPIGLFTMTSGILAVLSLFIMRPHLAQLRLRNWSRLAANEVFWVGARILFWMSIARVGLVLTELVMLTTPIFLALISLVVFRERWTFRQTLAFVVIFVCVTTITLLPS